MKMRWLAQVISLLCMGITSLPLAAQDAVQDADALIIRTRTRCDRNLLDGSSVKFIASATIGYDHIDADYCNEQGITWTNAPGCNSSSVEQYIVSVLLHSFRLFRVFQQFFLL